VTAEPPSIFHRPPMLAEPRSPSQQPPVVRQRSINPHRAYRPVTALIQRAGHMGALVGSTPMMTTVIIPLLSQTTAATPAGSANPGRANPKAARDSRATPTDATTKR